MEKERNIEAEHESNYAFPTPPDQEDVTPTDMISEAVQQVVDNIQHTFDNDPET